MFARMPYVVSTSGIISYRRCRKAFELANVRNLDVPSSDVAELGTNFHEIAAAMARRDKSAVARLRDSEMAYVASQYFLTHPLPQDIIGVEEPIYTKVLDELYIPIMDSDGKPALRLMPAVFLRTTHDLVYREDGLIVGRDYKTFDRASTYDVDLDFQGRSYVAALMAHYQTPDVRFEWENVRRAAPGSPRGAWDFEENGRFFKRYANGSRKEVDTWAFDECYSRVEVSFPPSEIATTWRELQDTCRDLIRNVEVEHRWFRTDLKGNFHGCSSCFYRNLCAAEMRDGALTRDDIDILSTPHSEAARMTPDGLLRDPRVAWWAAKNDCDAPTAIKEVYGEEGVNLFLTKYPKPMQKA